ncbi:LacI family DNA-binding transcriptional regulator [Leifsonia virtsii]|uniref:LacI family DNA-binding transcriptional regulator n=1 Tax=Leifsonia virtsii TaxID=3035915 RepID=A0ABT8J1Z8_9MICO|nr:LacI family DNA-binding transcriptional regulator [Leifsonia virtsii]MDN4599108.1 LacI family DNA-binding transcriptional regulator [Leifsonia virtsii]
MADRVTIADVAAKAGLSKSAVSLILNDRPGTRLSPETAERVRRIAEELNYRPNPAARTLFFGKAPMIGFVSDDVTLTRYASAMIRGLLDVAEDREHTVLIAETGHHPERLGGVLDAMVDRRAAGLVFGSMAARQVELPPLPDDIPVVMLNATTTTDYPVVLPDERAAGAAMAQLLIDAGHRRIGLIGRISPEILPPEESVTILDRFAGIDGVLAENDIELVADLHERHWEPEAGYRMARELIEDGLGITGLICLNDNLAFGVYQAFQEAGVRIPDDVSIVSFDDDVLASILRPALSTARIPYEQMGRKAMELALAGDTTPARHLIPMPVVQRQSVKAVAPRA